MIGNLLFYAVILMLDMNESSIYTKLSPNVYEINDQYFYSSKVHIYLIELADKVLLFDIPTYSEEAKTFILSFNKPVSAILSHGSCGIEDGIKWQKEIGLKVFCQKADENHPWIRMQPDVLFTKPPNFGDDVEVILTPGHSAGSICLFHYPSKALFTGDTVYGNEDENIIDITQEVQQDYENLDDRIESCKMLLNYDFKHIYPFHYSIIYDNAKEKLVEYLNGL